MKYTKTKIKKSERTIMKHIKNFWKTMKNKN